MIRAFLIAAVVAIAGAYQAGSLTTAQRSATVPVVTAGIDHSGTRIHLPRAKLLEVSGGIRPTHPVKSLLNVPGRIRYGEYVWDESGVADGPLWVFVDLTAQTMSVFRGNHEIGATVLLYGAEEMPTPTGRFTVLQMTKDHWSRTYDAPMPYSLWLTKDGVAIHGSDVRPGSATHGCLGVPPEFAKRLFAEANIGAEVFVTRAPRLTASPA
jgi:lipoprotein-anchoring transpeptidase ErfK/SrfK